jgi:hypothetical protein
LSKSVTDPVTHEQTHEIRSDFPDAEIVAGHWTYYPYLSKEDDT